MDHKRKCMFQRYYDLQPEIHMSIFPGTLILPNGQKACWAHIEALEKLQSREGLRCGNRLTTKHIHFEGQIMKVSLAAQTLSASVADGLQYCREILRHPQFQNTEGTEFFLRLVDKLFDLLNISNSRNSGWKKPISLNNQSAVKSFFLEARAILTSIKDERHTAMIRHPRKTPFVGLCVDMNSVVCLIDEFIVSRRWQFLLTYKFSQDHLELLFNSIRRTGKKSFKNVACTPECCKTIKY